MGTEKTGVTRWERDYDFIYEDPDGEYVLFTDHERVVGELQAEIHRLRCLNQEMCRTALSLDDEHHAEANALRTALAASRAEVEGMRRDAERYRWLAERNDWDIQPRAELEDGIILSVTVYSPQRLFDKFGEMDDIGGAIDAAIANDKGEGNG